MRVVSRTSLTLAARELLGVPSSLKEMRGLLSGLWAHTALTPGLGLLGDHPPHPMPPSGEKSCTCGHLAPGGTHTTKKKKKNDRLSCFSVFLIFVRRAVEQKVDFIQS